MTQRCDFTDLLVDQCSHCTGRGEEVDERDLTVVNRFIARYPGRCAACDAPFIDGDWIGRTADGEYVGEECF